MIAVVEACSIFQYIGHGLMKLISLRTSCWHQIEDIIPQGKNKQTNKQQNISQEKKRV